MLKVFLRASLLFVLGLVLLVGFRMAYGYVTLPNGEIIRQTNQYSLNNSYDFELVRKNYAGQKSAPLSGPKSIDQRFEKVATLGTASSAFDKDEALVRQIAKDSEALIQHEQAFGLAGRRQLQLALGVNPTKFDAVMGQIREIGKLKSFQVNKVDKTNEYRALLAQRDSLQKSRDALVALKERDAELSDLITLETRVLELEHQIQNLGVSVGEFDSEFEFVTIKLTMVEVSAPKVRDISLIERLKVALEWAIKAYAALCGAFLMFMIGAGLLMFVLNIGRSFMPKN